MNVVLVNLSNRLYEGSRKRLNESAMKFGVDRVISYDFDDIKTTEFYQLHKQILDQTTGMGNWLWKPFIIQQAMNSLSDGDVLVYADSGIAVIADLDPLINICRSTEPILLFANGDLKNSAWTKRDCFALMDCDSEKYWSGLQVDAAICLFRTGVQSKQFIEEWLSYACDDRIVTNKPNTTGLQNLPDFVEHRHDQSILSLLAIKHGIELYRVPSQFGNHYKTRDFRVKGEENYRNQLMRKQLWHYSKQPFGNSPYYQLLDHHRSKSGIGSKQSLNIVGLFRRIFERLKRTIQKIIPIT